MTTHVQAREECAQAIRDAIMREDRPLSHYLLTIHAGFTPRTLTRIVFDMLARGELKRLRHPNGTIYYDLPGRAPVKHKPKGQIAAPITIGRGSVWGARTGGQLS